MGFKIESGLLDACALAILEKGDTYGYEITQSMKKAITVSEQDIRSAVPGQEQAVLLDNRRGKSKAAGLPLPVDGSQECDRCISRC